jgi:hypothetical protein
MCFYIRIPADKKRHKAIKNITCYKIGLKRRNCNIFRSSIMDYDYTLGKLNKLSSLPKPKFGDWENQIVMRVGFHSFSDESTVQEIKNGRLYDGERIVKCIIPKGATYCFNESDHVYISNQIIIKEYIKTKRLK